MCTFVLPYNIMKITCIPTKEHTHAHTPHQTIPLFSSILGAAVPKQASWHVSLFLCPIPLFSYSCWCGETQPTPLFAPIPKEQQLLVVFCHLSFLSLWTKHKTMAHSEKALWVWSSQKKGFSVSAAVIGHIWMAWILLNIVFFILQIPTVCFKA